MRQFYNISCVCAPLIIALCLFCGRMPQCIFYFGDLNNMAITNFSVFLNDALQGNPHAQQQWTEYCLNNFFTDDERAQAKKRISEIIRDNTAAQMLRANAFILRGIFCQFGQYHTPPSTSQSFILTAKHCYQQAQLLGHQQAADKLERLTIFPTVEAPATQPSLDLTWGLLRIPAKLSP